MYNFWNKTTITAGALSGVKAVAAHYESLIIMKVIYAMIFYKHSIKNLIIPIDLFI